MSISWKTQRAPEVVTPPPSDALRKAGRAAFVWVVVFIAFHVYWACGGTFGFGDATETQPKVDSLAKLIFSVVVFGMFAAGTVVPLALYQDWGRRVPAWVLAACCWIGGVLLMVRGFSGVLDTSLRGTGLVRNGLTGLTYKQELGVAHPSAYTIWSGTSIDLYFTLGGILFLLAAICHRRSRRRATPGPAGPDSAV
ncbi:DUF3995 domain-containing protein [Actinacidiphila acidipaludis]|uniref:DUF3995 domain-containing protein n=1 Tax=Actinacidiphila acidipaludis TaxID=2873382 RepID=A0ABS7Q2Q9_9ACTN|nr:DUF3995 domain-containing protein [Streptomyces acidipaludis]MBY8877415.1 DUF3995 domain-containing protein [Streptomyces acidipaludis]